MIGPFKSNEGEILREITKVTIIFLLLSLCVYTFLNGMEKNPLPINEKSITAQLESLPLANFFDTSYFLICQRNPDTIRNFPDFDFDRYPYLTNISDEYRKETAEVEKTVLELLSSRKNQINKEDRLSFEIYEWLLKTRIESVSYLWNEWQVNGYGSWDYVNRLLQGLVDYPVKTVDEAARWISLISQIPEWIEHLLGNLRTREANGFIQPRLLLDSAIAQIENALGKVSENAYRIENTDLYRSFIEKIETSPSFPIESRSELVLLLKYEMERSFLPSFLKLKNELVLLKEKAPSEGSCCSYPNGKSYYAFLLNRYTGASLTPDELFAIGVDYLEMLQKQILAVAGLTENGALKTLEEVERKLNLSFRPLEEPALLREYERILVQVETKSIEFFDLFPTRDVILSIDKSSPSPAYYQSPGEEDRAPGLMVVNLVDPGFSTLYTPISLINHETIPGHHVQLALLRDIEFPSFRNILYTDVYLDAFEFQGYMEGWALYGQWLGWEMGVYEKDSLQLLRLFRLMINQGVRMVAEIGIHYYGWSRQQAADYCQRMTGRSYSASQMNRYIAVPGQAVCYNFGVIEILRLRQYAMNELGEHFNIRDFHDAVLRCGPVPIGFLSAIIEEWVSEKKSDYQ